jgi:hypothetical protein
MGITIEVVVAVGIGAVCTVVYMGTSVVGTVVGIGAVGKLVALLASSFASTTLSFGVDEDVASLPMSLRDVRMRDSI